MHLEALQFVATTTARLMPRRIVEYGSRDLNGSPRMLFPGVTYTGVDITPGNGVDVVADAVDWKPRYPCDLLLCLEVMEHTPAWPELVLSAQRALAPGGLFIVTAACPDRPAHSATDGGPLREGEFYENVNPDLLWATLLTSGFTHIHTEAYVERGDVYATGTKPR